VSDTQPPESLASSTLHASETDDDSWLSYHWSGKHQRAQSHPSGFLSRHDSFASTAASEASAVVHTPGSGGYSLELGAHRSQTDPLNHWEINQSGAPTTTSYAVSARARPPTHYPADTFPQENANTSHWPRTDPTRVEMMPTGQYQPYEVSRTRPTWHRNAEAGPSTLVAPLIPCISPPKSRSCGRAPETTADAETNQTITEEDRAPVSIFTVLIFLV